MTVRIYKLHEGVLQSARTLKMTDDEFIGLRDKYGVSSIFNMWHTADARWYGAPELYRHCSVPDGLLHQSTIDIANNLADIGAEHVRQGGVLLTHCYGGRNRAGLVSALVLRRLLGITGEHAACLVRLGRPNSLVNKHFSRYLGELAAPPKSTSQGVNQ